MPIITVPLVTIPLTDIVRNGDSQIIVRVDQENKKLIDKAAKLIGMSQAEFSRTVLVQAARRVIKEGDER